MKKLIRNPEIRNLVHFALLTGIATAFGLAFRYVLLAFAGNYTVSIAGRSFPFSITDNTAYFAYYISSVVLLYLLKWRSSGDAKATGFFRRFVAFFLLNLLTMFIGNAILSLLTDRLGLHHELAFWITCVPTFLLNFLGTRFLVFFDLDNRKAKKQTAAGASAEGDDTNGR